MSRNPNSINEVRRQAEYDALLQYLRERNYPADVIDHFTVPFGTRVQERPLTDISGITDDNARHIIRLAAYARASGLKPQTAVSMSGPSLYGCMTMLSVVVPVLYHKRVLFGLGLTLRTSTIRSSYSGKVYVEQSGGQTPYVAVMSPTGSWQEYCTGSWREPMENALHAQRFDEALNLALLSANEVVYGYDYASHEQYTRYERDEYEYDDDDDDYDDDGVGGGPSFDSFDQSDREEALAALPTWHDLKRW
jgi:hypothetical protein